MRILIYGLAKSGTTVLHLKIRKGMESYLNAPVKEVFEPIYRNGETLIKRDKSEYDLAEHTLVKALLPVVEGEGAPTDSILNDYGDFEKKIFIVRDPRDRAISAFFYRWFHLHKPLVHEFERALRLTQYKEKHPSDIPFYALFTTNPKRNAAWQKRQIELHDSVLDFIREAKSKDWFILKYEDLMDNNVYELENYLGFTITSKDPKDSRFAHVARSKSYGDWRKWFTKEDEHYYRPLYEKYMEENGYDISDWKVDEVDSLSPKSGSEYMLKLYKGTHYKRSVHRWTNKFFGKKRR